MAECEKMRLHVVKSESTSSVIVDFVDEYKVPYDTAISFLLSYGAYYFSRMKKHYAEEGTQEEFKEMNKLALKIIDKLYEKEGKIIHD